MDAGLSSAHTAVVGLAWGDEGKGKIVDLLSADFDIVVRFNGGANAGHTVCVGGEKFALHLLPVGLLREDVIGVIGPGVVVDPIGLLGELDELAKRGRDVACRLRISDRAHLVMPYHQIEDRLREGGGAAQRIGTTARGIGPCYADKMLRSPALRMVDLLDLQSAEARVRKTVDGKRSIFQARYGDDGGINFGEIWGDLRVAAERLGPMIADCSSYLLDQADAGKRIFFEGANGPFETSQVLGAVGGKIKIDGGVNFGDHAPHSFAQQRCTFHGGKAPGIGLIRRRAEIGGEQCRFQIAGEFVVRGGVGQIKEWRVEACIIPIDQPQAVPLVDKIRGQHIVMTEDHIDGADRRFQLLGAAQQRGYPIQMPDRKSVV